MTEALAGHKAVWLRHTRERHTWSPCACMHACGKVCTGSPQQPRGADLDGSAPILLSYKLSNLYEDTAPVQTAHWAGWTSRTAPRWSSFLHPGSTSSDQPQGKSSSWVYLSCDKAAAAPVGAPATVPSRHNKQTTKYTNIVPFQLRQNLQFLRICMSMHVVLS